MRTAQRDVGVVRDQTFTRTKHFRDQRIFVGGSAGEAVASRFKLNIGAQPSSLASLRHAVTDGRRELCPSLGCRDVVARSAAAESDYAPRPITDQRRGAGLSSINAQKVLGHFFLSLSLD